MLPWESGASSACMQATFAPPRAAVSTVDMPAAPAPTTTISKSWVSATSVMGSGLMRNEGVLASASAASTAA